MSAHAPRRRAAVGEARPVGALRLSLSHKVGARPQSHAQSLDVLTSKNIVMSKVRAYAKMVKAVWKGQVRARLSPYPSHLDNDCRHLRTGVAHERVRVRVRSAYARAERTARQPGCAPTEACADRPAHPTNRRPLLVHAHARPQVIAETAAPQMVDGNVYYPRSALKSEFFTPNSKTTVCGWKVRRAPQLEPRAHVRSVRPS